MISAYVVICVTGQTGKVLDLYQYLMLFTGFYQHVDAGSDYFQLGLQLRVKHVSTRDGMLAPQQLFKRS